ncbi:MAG: PAS domain-containing protein [Thalassovita sp.]
MNTLPMNAFDDTHEPVTAVLAPEVNVEQSFGIGELFFSRTDKRGVIESFNEVFLRISGFSSEELTGAPHKLIRHSDMPKAVFWLLWDGLKKNKPVGAYVKNRTKSGQYYWVFAIATPVEDGYLSVRLRPTSELPEKVAALYKDLLRKERDEELSPKDSAEILLDELYDMGFPTYGNFQSYALYQEFEARRKALKRTVCPDLHTSDIIAEHSKSLQFELSMLAEKFGHAGLLTANMKIFAAKLEVGRATINEIAKNYDLMLRDIQNNLSTMDVPEDPEGIWETSKEQESFFMLCSSHLMSELCETFEKESRQGSGINTDLEMAELIKLREAYKVKADEAVEYGMQVARSVQRRNDFLQRMILGLSTVRIACRVEAGMLRDHAKGLNTIVSRLDSFHDEVESHLTKITLSVNAIIQSIDQHELENAPQTVPS